MQAQLKEDCGNWGRDAEKRRHNEGYNLVVGPGWCNINCLWTVGVSPPAEVKKKKLGGEYCSCGRCFPLSHPGDIPLGKEERRHWGPCLLRRILSLCQWLAILSKHQDHLRVFNKFWSPGHAPCQVNQKLWGRGPGTSIFWSCPHDSSGHHKAGNHRSMLFSCPI